MGKGSYLELEKGKALMEKDKWIDNVEQNLTYGGYRMKFDTACLWIARMQDGMSPIDSLRKKGIDSIVVYGMTELGELMVREAVNKQFKVKAITDKRVSGEYVYGGIPVIPVSGLLPSGYKDEYIVVTAMAFAGEIKKELNAAGIGKAVSLLDLL